MRYKTHRVVDGREEVITATTVTPGSVDDGHMLKDMVEAHEQNTQVKAETVVGDSKYGSMDNFLLCHDLGIKAHMPAIEQSHRGSGKQEGIFSKEHFSYDPQTDTFLCPGGKVLNRRHYYKSRMHYEYKASPETCNQCELKGQCTRAKDGRTLKRHERQDDLDLMLEEAKSRNAKRDIKTRQHISERSFARSTPHGLKRARWRRVWRMQIQDFLIAAVQNITILIRKSRAKLSKSQAQLVQGRYDLETQKAGLYSKLTLWLRHGLCNTGSQPT